jgi:hypothetical protein
VKPPVTVVLCGRVLKGRRTEIAKCDTARSIINALANQGPATFQGATFNCYVFPGGFTTG